MLECLRVNGCVHVTVCIEVNADVHLCVWRERERERERERVCGGVCYLLSFIYFGS